MSQARNYAAIRSQAELEDLVGRLAQFDDPVGFDVETGYDGPFKDKGALYIEHGHLVGFSISGHPEWARYVPLDHILTANLDASEALAALAPLSGRFVAHNTKFERRWLRKYGFDYQFISDTMIEAYVLAEWKSIGLKNLVKQIYGHDQAEIASLFPKLTKKEIKGLRFNDLELTPQVISYACEDVSWTLALHNRNFPLVKDHFIYRLEMSLQTQICEMEERGILWDWDFLSAKGAEVTSFMEELQREISADLGALVGTAVNINLGSPKQIGDILFGKLGWHGAQKTKAGNYSTNAVSLKALSDQFPVVRKILQWKELKTLNTRYLLKWPKDYSFAKDGRAHSNHMQTGVGAGRFAVDGPPYQQTPKKYYYALTSGRIFEMNFRRAVKAAPGHYLLHYDLSQVELRAITGAAGEPVLLQAFAADEDVHVATAALMLGVVKAQVTKDMRDIGKTMNYALMYQMGPQSLADRLGLSLDRARTLFDTYFSAYSNIDVFVKRTKDFARRNGYIISHFGRKVTIWELQDSRPGIYAKGERLAVNAPIQGWASDYMKISMVRERKAREAMGWTVEQPGDTVHLIMNNHDALTYEVPDHISPEQVIACITPAVTFPVEGFPDIKADWAYGPDWGSMQDWTGKEREEAPFSPDLELSASDDEDDADDDSVDPDSPKLTLDMALIDRLVPTAPSEPLPAPIAPQVGGSSPDMDAPSQVIVVELPAMPMEDQLLKFISVLQSSPGNNIVELVTPQGSVLWEDDPTSISSTDAPAIGLIFGRASVSIRADSVDTAALMEGLSL